MGKTKRKEKWLVLNGNNKLNAKKIKIISLLVRLNN